MNKPIALAEAEYLSIEDPRIIELLAEEGYQELAPERMQDPKAYLGLDCFFHHPEIAIEEANDYFTCDLGEETEENKRRASFDVFGEGVPAHLVMTPIGALNEGVQQFLSYRIEEFVNDPEAVCPHAVDHHGKDAVVAAKQILEELKQESSFGYVTLTKGPDMRYIFRRGESYVDGFMRLALVGEEVEYAKFFAPNSFISALDVEAARNISALGDLTDMELLDLLVTCAYLNFPGDKLFFKKSSKEKEINGIEVGVSALSNTIKMKCREQHVNVAQLMHVYNQVVQLIVNERNSGNHDITSEFDWDTHNKILTTLEEKMGGSLHMSPMGSNLTVKATPYIILASAEEELARSYRAALPSLIEAARAEAKTNNEEKAKTNAKMDQIERETYQLGMDLSIAASEHPHFTNKMITAFVQYRMVVEDQE